MGLCRTATAGVHPDRLRCRNADLHPDPAGAGQSGVGAARPPIGVGRTGRRGGPRDGPGSTDPDAVPELAAEGTERQLRPIDLLRAAGGRRDRRTVSGDAEHRRPVHPGHRAGGGADGRPRGHQAGLAIGPCQHGDLHPRRVDTVVLARLPVHPAVRRHVGMVPGRRLPRPVVRVVGMVAPPGAAGAGPQPEPVGAAAAHHPHQRWRCSVRNTSSRRAPRAWPRAR